MRKALLVLLGGCTALLLCWPIMAQTVPSSMGGGGGIAGSGVAGRCALWSSATALTSDSGCAYTGTGATLALAIGGSVSGPIANFTNVTGGNVTDSALTAGRVTFAGTNGLLSDDADMTFSGGDTLTVTKLIGSTSITASGTSGFITREAAYFGGAQFGGFSTIGFHTAPGQEGSIVGAGVGIYNLSSNRTIYLDAGAFTNGGVTLASSGKGFAFTSSATEARSATPDTNLSRVSAGVVGVGTGAAGSVAGSLSLTGMTNAGALILTSDQGYLNIGTTASGVNAAIINSTPLTPDGPVLFTGSTSNSFHIFERSDSGFDFNNGPGGTSATTDPTLIIHSHNQTTTEWLGLTHDGTNGVLSVGTGVVSIPAGTTTAGTIKSTRTTDIGWSVVVGANTACNTTCTNACVFGEDTSVVGTVVGCTDATADLCLCAGSN